MNNLIHNARFIRSLDLVAAGQGTNNGTPVDMTGYHNCTFICEFCVATTACQGTLSVEAGATTASFTALSGVTIGTSETGGYLAGEQYLLAEVVDLSTDYQFIRPVVVTANANLGIGGVMTIVHNPRVQRPITQSTGDGFAGQVISASPTT